MELLPSEENKEKPVVTIVGKKRIIKDKTLKIRLDVFELAEVDRIANSIGFAERATAIRWLLQHYNDLKMANQLVLAYMNKKKADVEFETIIENFKVG